MSGRVFLGLPLFVGVMCLVFVLLCIAFCPFEFFNYLDMEERAVFFSLICLPDLSVLLLFLTVSWDVLPYVIVVFADHTHLL